MKTWKRRWFILTDSCLYYFEFTTVSLTPRLPQPLPELPNSQSTKSLGPPPGHPVLLHTHSAEEEH